MGSGTVATIGLPVGEPERVPHLGDILEHFERGEIYNACERSANGAPHIYGAYRYAAFTEAREIFLQHFYRRYINEIHTRHIELDKLIAGHVIRERAPVKTPGLDMAGGGAPAPKNPRGLVGGGVFFVVEGEIEVGEKFSTSLRERGIAVCTIYMR